MCKILRFILPSRRCIVKQCAGMSYLLSLKCHQDKQLQLVQIFVYLYILYILFCIFKVAFSGIQLSEMVGECLSIVGLWHEKAGQPVGSTWICQITLWLCVTDCRQWIRSCPWCHSCLSVSSSSSAHFGSLCELLPICHWNKFLRPLICACVY